MYKHCVESTARALRSVKREMKAEKVCKETRPGSEKGDIG